MSEAGLKAFASRCCWVLIRHTQAFRRVAFGVLRSWGLEWQSLEGPAMFHGTLSLLLVTEVCNAVVASRHSMSRHVRFEGIVPQFECCSGGENHWPLIIDKLTIYKVGRLMSSCDWLVDHLVICYDLLRLSFIMTRLSYQVWLVSHGFQILEGAAALVSAQWEIIEGEAAIEMISISNLRFPLLPHSDGAQWEIIEGEAAKEMIRIKDVPSAVTRKATISRCKATHCFAF